MIHVVLTELQKLQILGFIAVLQEEGGNEIEYLSMKQILQLGLKFTDYEEVPHEDTVKSIQQLTEVVFNSIFEY